MTREQSSESPRAAIVTGAAKRIGRAIALELARSGWSVALHHGGSPLEARQLAAEIEANGGRTVALRADLTDEAALERLMTDAVAALGPLGLLVNNASTFENDGIADSMRKTWDLHMEVNLRAPFVLSQAFVRQLPDSAHGNIVNLLDQRVWNLTPHFLTYTLSKSALWTLTRTLAMALAPRIRVNAIGPGPALPSVHQTVAQFADQCARMPLGRGTTPEEIAAALNYILAAPAMTGQMIALDGGQHLGWSHAAGGSID
jgi:NAD(P)-dependent dehydrogenase (short-subunit alcohol dehydrogenase family)